MNTARLHSIIRPAAIVAFLPAIGWLACSSPEETDGSNGPITTSDTGGQGGQGQGGSPPACGNDTGSYLWADDFGDPGEEHSWGVGVDAAGNVSVAGYWTPGSGAGAGLDLGCGELAAESLTPPQTDSYVGKLSAVNGTCLWSHTIMGTSGSGRHEVWNAAVDAAGNVVVVGEFTEDIDFDGNGTAEVGVKGESDTFVASYASVDGALRWWRTFGASDAQVAAYGVAVDAADNVVVVGRFHGNVVHFGSDTGFPPDGSDGFVVRLAGADGAHINSATYGGPGNQSGSYVAVDAVGNVVVGAQDQDGDGDYGDILLLALSSDLAATIWEKHFGDDDGNSQWVLDVDTLASGDVVLAGLFGGALNLGMTELVAAGTTSAFAGRLLAADGSELWARNWGEAGDGAFVAAMAVDGCDRIVLGGGFSGVLDFGGSAAPLDSGAAESQDAFLAKLGADGSGIWAYGFGDDLTGENTGQAVERVATNVPGAVAVAGRFHGSIDLGGGQIPCATCEVNSLTDEFVGAFTK